MKALVLRNQEARKLLRTKATSDPASSAAGEIEK
jgi:hypothetical protein